MRYINLSLKLNIKKGRRNILKKNISKKMFVEFLVRSSVQVVFTILLNITLLFGSSYPLISDMNVNIVNPIKNVEAKTDNVKSFDSDIISKQTANVMVIKSDDVIENVKVAVLQEKYRKLAGSYYYSNVEPYLEIIDKVLAEKGLDDDVLFIQAMFFIGQHESHWNTGSISGFSVGREHPTGIFQFLPSTFRSVSSGDIYDAEDQIRAYVTMVERGRIREFGTLYLPGLSPIVEQYVINYN